MVGMESLLEYPDHYGSEQTLLLSPTTIPENGVEVDCVMELLITGDNEAILTEDIQDNDTHTVACTNISCERTICWDSAHTMPWYKHTS